MPNAAIPLMVNPIKIPDPLEGYSKAMTLKQLLGQQQLQDMQLAQARRATDKQARFQRFGQESKGNLMTLRDLLYGAGDIEEGLSLDTGIRQRDKAAQEAQKSKLDLLKEQNDMTSRLLASVMSASEVDRPRVYQAVRSRAIERGLMKPDDPEYPEVWSPTLLPLMQRDLYASLTTRDALERMDEDAVKRFLAQDTGPQVGAVTSEDLPVEERQLDIARGSEGVPMFDYLTEMDIRQGRKTYRDEGDSGVVLMPTEKETKPPPVDVESEYQNPVSLRKKASNLERQAQQVLTMRGGEKDAAELRQQAAQYRMDADRIEGRTQELEKREGELIEIADPSSPSGTRFVKKSEAAGKPGAKKLGATTVYAAGGDIQLGKAGQTKVDEGLLDTTNRLMRLNQVEQNFKPEFQELGTKIKNKYNSLLAMAGVRLDPGERRQLEEFATYRRTALENLNEYIRAVTGAVINEHEVPRLMGAMPNPGQGLFDGDDPITFQAKLRDVVKMLRMGEARLVYIKRNGMSLQDVPLDRMPRIMLNREDELFEETRKKFPKAGNSERRAMVKRQLAQEFGLTAD